MNRADETSEGPLTQVKLMGPELFKSVMGGLLMGLANLVPGISGGTMLLAAGVYHHFVDGIAELSTFRFRLGTIVPLGVIVVAAGSAILFFAGPVKGLVVDHRWAMYSLFIGLTLGGVPVIWKLMHSWTGGATAGLLGGLAVMVALAFTEPGGPGERAYLMLFLAGLAGASAMILPGISGGYLLLVLGQYLVILGAIDQAKTGLMGSEGGPRWDVVMDAMHVFVPVGLGVVVGVIGVSNLIRVLLRRWEGPTYGALLGLVLGAVLGLWPFQEGVRPEVGAIVKNRVMTTELIAELDAEDYPLRKFPPAAGQVVGSLALIVAGFALTQGVAFIGRQERKAESGG